LSLLLALFNEGGKLFRVSQISDVHPILRIVVVVRL
jgi:hypothetical protein